MVSRLQRRIVLRKKLHILRTLTCSKSVKRSSIIADALLYIYKLKLKIEAIKKELSALDAFRRQYLTLPMVKVEKAAERGFLVKVICEKGGDKMVPILAVFEEMGLVVLHAKVSCNFYFAMEALVGAAQEHHLLDVKNVTQSLLEAVERDVERGNRKEA